MISLTVERKAPGGDSALFKANCLYKVRVEWGLRFRRQVFFKGQEIVTTHRDLRGCEEWLLLIRVSRTRYRVIESEDEARRKRVGITDELTRPEVERLYPKLKQSWAQLERIGKGRKGADGMHGAKSTGFKHQKDYWDPRWKITPRHGTHFVEGAKR